MRLFRLTRFTVVSGLLVLAGCSEQVDTSDPADPASGGSVADQSVQESGVERTVQQTPEDIERNRTTVAEPIATAAGPLGVNMALESVRVTGDVLTVQLRTSAPLVECCESELIDVEQVSVIDDSTAQQLGVLRDNQGNWLAAPMKGGSSDNIRLPLHETAVLWFKFPAPPATTRTVSINIPKIAPFDGVPVTR